MKLPHNRNLSIHPPVGPRIRVSHALHSITPLDDDLITLSDGSGALRLRLRPSASPSPRLRVSVSLSEQFQTDYLSIAFACSVCILQMSTKANALWGSISGQVRVDSRGGVGRGGGALHLMDSRAKAISGTSSAGDSRAAYTTKYIAEVCVTIIIF